MLRQPGHARGGGQRMGGHEGHRAAQPLHAEVGPQADRGVRVDDRRPDTGKAALMCHVTLDPNTSFFLPLYINFSLSAKVIVLKTSSQLRTRARWSGWSRAGWTEL